MKEFDLSEKIDQRKLGKLTEGVIPTIYIKEFIRRLNKPFDINERCIGFQLSDKVVFVINQMFKERTKKLVGDKLR